MGEESGRRILDQLLILMKEITLWIRSMDKEHLGGKVGIYIMEGIEMMKEMVSGKCNGLMGQFIKVNGKEEYNMEKEE